MTGVSLYQRKTRHFRQRYEDKLALASQNISILNPLFFVDRDLKCEIIRRISRVYKDRLTRQETGSTNKAEHNDDNSTAARFVSASRVICIGMVKNLLIEREEESRKKIERLLSGSQYILICMIVIN